MNLYQLEPILMFLVFTWVFYLHGAFVGQKLQLNQQGVDKLFIHLIIGFSLVVFALFFIALFQLLYLPFVTVFFLIIPSIYIFHKIKQKDFSLNIGNIGSGIINHAWLIFIILYLILSDTYTLFLPESSSDALRYHLPYAQFYVDNHGLAVNEFLRYPVFSHNMNMTFSLGYLFLGDYQGEVLARMFSLFSFILLVLGLYSLTLRSFNKTTAVIAVMFLVKAKTFKILMISGYIDIGLSLFLFSCIYFLYLWQQEKQDKWLYLAACILGIVIGTKYLGLLWLLPLAIWVFFVQRNWQKALTFFFLALVIGSPWYIRNIIIAGNPLHPFLQDVFGYWLWSNEDIVNQKLDLLKKHGVERTLFNFLMLPYLLETVKYFTKLHIGLLMVVGMPFLIFAITMQRFYKYLAVFVFLNIGFWFFTSQIDRYLMPTLAFVAIFAAYPIGKLLSPIVSYKWFANKYSMLIIALVLLSLGVNKVIDRFNKLNDQRSLPSSNLGWHNANLEQNKYYPFVMELNARKAERVFNASDAMFGNSFHGLVLGDWFGIANKKFIYRDCKTENDVFTKLVQFNTPYLLVSKQKKWYNKVNTILSTSKKFHIILETNEAILYHIQI